MCGPELTEEERSFIDGSQLVSLQVRVAGQYVTVLLDPNSFDDILKDSVFLDVSQSRSRMIERVFSLQLSSVQAAAERSWMER